MIVARLQKSLRSFYIYSKIFSRDLGILDGHKDYCRFVVVGKGRSGSNFLFGLLNSHSQIFTFGEIFRRPNSIGWDRPGYREYLQSRYMISLMQDNPVFFLEKEVFRKFPRNITAVGFKIFYHQAKGDSRESVWNFLKDKKDIKVIHLKRKNILKRLLSMKKAYVTGQWAKRNKDSESHDNIRISLTYDECLKEFTNIRHNQIKYDDFFADHQKIDLLYEDLAHDYENEIRRVQNFLGVEYEILCPSTYKQSSQSLSQEISNYFELKEKFQDTPWESFFEE